MDVGALIPCVILGGNVAILIAISAMTAGGPLSDG